MVKSLDFCSQAAWAGSQSYHFLGMFYALSELSCPVCKKGITIAPTYLKDSS